MPAHVRKQPTAIGVRQPIGSRKRVAPATGSFAGHSSHTVVQHGPFWICTLCGCRTSIERPVYRKVQREECRRKPMSAYYRRALHDLQRGRNLQARELRARFGKRMRIR